ncbi:hypothetical protein RU01_09720 [Rhodococcus sp. MEB064]|nr:hypothetical protein RU01_09720 [Rhodococcus sp. MEB064]
MQGLIDEVHSTPLAHGNDRIYYPGEVEDVAAERNLADGGVVLADRTLDDLRALASESGTALSF